jgi:FG-GAP repeat protein
MNKTAAICNVIALCTVLACTVAQAQDVSFIARRDFAAGVGPISMAVGDFNRDGVPDLAVGDENLGEISVLLGNGNGTFRSALRLRSARVLFP